MTNLIIYVTPTVIEVTILYVLLILFLNTRFIQRSRAIAVLITLIAIDSYLTIFISESIPYIRALLIPIAVSLSSILLFKDKIIKIFYFVALGYYFVYFSDIFSGLILSNLLNKNILQVIDVTDFYGILFYILTKSIMLLLIYGYYHFFNKLNLNISYHYLMIMNCILTIGAILIENFMSIISGNLPLNNTGPLSHKILIMVILLNITICLTIYLFSQLSLYYQNREFELNLQATSTVLKNEIKIQNKKELELSHMRHDFKENIISIKYMIENELDTEAINYVNQITGQLEKVKAQVLTGNVYIDAVLNNNIQLCASKDIELSLKVDQVQTESLEPVSLSDILINLLKNAVAATEKLPPEKRKISVKIFEYKHKLVLIVNNSHAETHLGSKVNLSTKSWFKHEHHGLGIGIIKKSIDRLDGDYKIAYDETHFDMLVLLPIDQK
ncbi:GHKL domain-containing protein [Latilactobacillus sakei]|uniref:sensor histidine kinase n=1 Tax=Latilactobacillus sakei TaxID=1599 RepID=UPI00077C39BE|nr:GHKL domain-containing protein [Latilactobacillus sakei]MDM5043650.1 GHKL domain-containing protein [Latilactobacillus sakei]